MKESRRMYVITFQQFETISGSSEDVKKQCKTMHTPYHTTALDCIDWIERDDLRDDVYNCQWEVNVEVTSLMKPMESFRMSTIEFVMDNYRDWGWNKEEALETIIEITSGYLDDYDGEVIFPEDFGRHR